MPGYFVLRMDRYLPLYVGRFEVKRDMMFVEDPPEGRKLCFVLFKSQIQAKVNRKTVVIPHHKTHCNPHKTLMQYVIMTRIFHLFINILFYLPSASV